MKREVIWLVVVLALAGLFAFVRLSPIHQDRERDAVYEAIIRYSLSHQEAAPLVISIHGQPWPAQFMRRLSDLGSTVRNLPNAELRFDHAGTPSYFDKQTHKQLAGLDLKDIVWQQPGLWTPAQATVHVTEYRLTVSVAGQFVPCLAELQLSHHQWQMTSYDSETASPCR